MTLSKDFMNNFFRTSKKRVLGLCADCKKPITAGARQMHMFFHLGKDQDVAFII